MPRPTLDSAVTEFTLTIGTLIRRIRAAAASHELSLTESAVLGRLVKNGPATIADLARAESMKPQSMGTTVAALEEMGLVARKQHPTDGRQLNIEITAKGALWRHNHRHLFRHTFGTGSRSRRSREPHVRTQRARDT